MLELPPALPVWAFIPIVAVLLAIVTEIGYRLGRRTRLRPSHEAESAVTDLSTPAVGLLGLMLAFTFGWAATRFDARASARLDEAKQVANVFRLADFLSPADRDRARAIIRDYIKISLDAQNPHAFNQAFERREGLHRELWAIAVRTATVSPGSETAKEFVRELDDLLNSHLTRSILAESSRIPMGILFGLFAILVLTMGMLGYQMGLRSRTRSLALVPLIVSIALVVFLIVDLDRPIEGVLTISNRALAELQEELEAWK